jgi:hypothetical protein
MDMRVALYARYSTDNQSVASRINSASVVSMRAGSVGRSSIPIMTLPSPAPVSFSGRADRMSPPRQGKSKVAAPARIV